MSAGRHEYFATARLRMRPLGEGDEALYCRLYCTPALMRFIAAPMAPAAARRSFGIALRQQAPLVQRWIVSDRESGHDLGLLGLVGQGDGPEIGVMLVAEGQGRGLGSEAMAGMMAHAFATRPLQWLYARQSLPDNPPVVRMMLRLGFTPRTPSAARPQGGEWELRRERWQSGRAAEVAAAAAIG